MQGTKGAPAGKYAIAVVALGLSSLAARPAEAQDDSSAPPPKTTPPQTSPPPKASDDGESSKEAPRERTANNALYVELLGPALLYSLNYDRAFGSFAARIGFEYFKISSAASDGSSASATFVAVPLSVSYLGLGSLNHMFELGAGAALWYFSAGVNTLGNSASGSTAVVVGNLILGYRYQPSDGGFFFRVGLSPLIGSNGNFLPWPHLGLGATF